MANQQDLDLERLFADSAEQVEDDIFVERVSGKITQRRRMRGGLKVLVAVLATLLTVLLGLNDFFATGTGLLAQVVVALALSPAGWVIGGGAGLFVFLRAR